MTHRQIEKLLATHTSQMLWAKKMLDERYYELEERGEEMIWINRYVYHKDAVTWLEKQKPDDE